MSRDQFELQPHIASDGWYLKIRIDSSITSTDLVKRLRESKVITPRSRYSFLDEHKLSFFYIEFRSWVHGIRFVKRLKNYIEQNGGSIL